jgi:hypothetical protein
VSHLIIRRVDALVSMALACFIACWKKHLTPEPDWSICRTR